MRIKMAAIVSVLSVLLATVSCSSASDAPLLNVEGHEFHGENSSLVKLDGPRFYDEDEFIEPNPETVGEDGIYHYVKNGTEYFHGVGQAQHALSMLSNWKLTEDKKYLDFAIANADIILENVGTGTPWANYMFDFPLHGDPANTIHAP